MLQCRGRVFIQRCHLRCLASRRASIVLVFYCLQVVVVAVIVDLGGLPVCCDVYWFFHGWRHVRDVEVCMERMIYYIRGCIRYGSKNFGLWSLHDCCVWFVGLAGATPQFYSVAPCRFDYRFVDEWLVFYRQMGFFFLLTSWPQRRNDINSVADEHIFQ